MKSVFKDIVISVGAALLAAFILVVATELSGTWWVIPFVSAGVFVSAFAWLSLLPPVGDGD